jgi:hypothetical protein
MNQDGDEHVDFDGFVAASVGSRTGERSNTMP